MLLQISIYTGYFQHFPSWVIPLIFILEKSKANVSSQKIFFDNLAHKKGFHPINQPHRWYDITKDDVLSCKVRVVLTVTTTF